MRQVKYILFWTFLISVFSSCIEPFSPDFRGQSTIKYVVYGEITDQEGYQTVSVSMTSTINKPKYNPLIGCKVKITDDQGNVFNLDETNGGNYRVWMGKEHLNPGSSYQVDVLTQSGVEIVSDFDQMPECPEIDTIYYVRKNVPTTDPEKPLQGIQFYLDLDGRNTNSHFYRWDITETWEHHAAYPKTLYWNGRNFISYNPPDYSMFYCWSTQNVGTIFTLSTKDLVENRFSRFPFHFVDNMTQRLTYGYSLLVKQYALSEPAYIYWDKLRINSNEQGGLYEVQPLRIKGNLKSTTNPNLEILGFFNASPLRTKRIFVRNVENLERYYLICTAGAGPIIIDEPKYLVPSEGGRGSHTVEDVCVECNVYGGTNVKPDYWPY